MDETKKNWEGNVGEWGEPYVLCKVLSEKKISAGLEESQSAPSNSFIASEVILDQENKELCFTISKDDIIEIKRADKEEPLKKTCSEFAKTAETIFEKIITHEKGERKFTVPGAQEFLESIGIERLKAPSKNGDIKIRIDDYFPGKPPSLINFSIKTELGGDPTFFNSATNTTKFTFRLLKNGKDFLFDIDIYELNNKIVENGEFIDLRRKTKKEPARPRFNDTANLFEWLNKEIDSDGWGFIEMDPKFKRNLLLLDSRMPELIVSILKKFYLESVGSKNDATKTKKSRYIDTLTEAVSKENPLKIDNLYADVFYKTTMKRLVEFFLSEVSASKPWDGNPNIGSIITVDKDGKIHARSMLNREKVAEAYFKNFYFDTPSKTKHDYGYIFSYVEVKARIVEPAFSDFEKLVGKYLMLDQNRWIGTIDKKENVDNSDEGKTVKLKIKQIAALIEAIEKKEILEIRHRAAERKLVCRVEIIPNSIRRLPGNFIDLNFQVRHLNGSEPSSS